MALAATALTVTRPLAAFGLRGDPSDPATREYARATVRLFNPAALAAFTHAPNCVLDFTFTHTSGLSGRVDYRRVDSSNSWILNILSNGNLQLVEDVAAVMTTRGSFTTAYATGSMHRIVIVVEGSAHRVYSDGILRIAYLDPLNLYLAQTSGLTRNIDGGFTEFQASPRYVALPPVAD